MQLVYFLISFLLVVILSGLRPPMAQNAIPHQDLEKTIPPVRGGTVAGARLEHDVLALPLSSQAKG